MAQITIDAKGNANDHLKKVAGGYREIGVAARGATKAAGDTEAAIERAEKKAERRIRKRAGDLREVTAGGFGGTAFAGVGAFAAGGAVGVAAFAAAKGLEAVVDSLNRTQEAAVKTAAGVRDVREESRKRQESDADAAFAKVAGMSVNEQRAAIAKDPRMAEVIAKAMTAKKGLEASETARLPALAAEGTARAADRILNPNAAAADEQIRARRNGIAELEDKAGNQNGVLAFLKDFISLNGRIGEGSDATIAARARKDFEETARSMRNAAASLDRAASRASSLPAN